MSLKFEQCYSLVKTQKFLRDLMHHSTRPKTVKEMRDRAYSCLKHFPFLDETGKPIWSKDNFPCPVIKPYDEKKPEA